MKQLPRGIALPLLVTMTLVASLAACKHSGVATTSRGQIMVINIARPGALAEGEVGQVKVSVKNRGVNNLSNIVFRVEFPSELIVVEEKRGAGMKGLMGVGEAGQPIYHYDVGDIEVTQESVVEYSIRAMFGTRTVSDNITVTVWDDDLPGGRLIETAAIRIRQ